MKIAIGCDHGGFELKQLLISYLKEMNYEFEDFGCYMPESMDYPTVAVPVARAVRDGKFDRGILVCGTGIGMSITANKVRGIRCALCSEGLSAKLTREHNNSNILALGGRIIGPELAKEIVKIWLETEFIGKHHTKRIQMITDLEKLNEC